MDAHTRLRKVYSEPRGLPHRVLRGQGILWGSGWMRMVKPIPFACSKSFESLLRKSATGTWTTPIVFMNFYSPLKIRICRTLQRILGSRFYRKTARVQREG